MNGFANKMIPLLCMISIATFTGCDHYDTIVFRNNSARNIYIMHWESFPDTTIPSLKPGQYIGAGDSAYLPNLGWKNTFDHNPSGILMWFVFDADTVKSVEWDVVRREYKVLKRYDLTFGELQRNSMRIVYP